MKRLVLILIVVLVLFGIMLSCGLTLDQSRSRATDKPGWMGILEPLSTKTPVATSDLLSTQCLVQGDHIARAKAPCAIHVRTSASSGVRTLKLVMVNGQSSKIDLQTLGQTGMQVEIPLRSQNQKSPEMQIPKEGAEVKVLCVEPGPDMAAGQVPDCRLRMSK